jgi:hypothetical protein
MNLLTLFKRLSIMCIDNLLFLCEVYMYVSTYVYVYYVYV